MERSLGNGGIADRIARVRENIANACAAVGRDPREVTLMAVTKTVDADRINEALAAGITHIGENRVQEFLGKRDALKLNGVEAHLIGHLQTNKVKQIVGKVDMIQSVDSERVARAIDSASAALGIVTPVLVEVNIGGEEAKSGISPDLLEELLIQIAQMPHVSVQGLMTVPPILEHSSEKRAIFAKMKKLFIDMREKNIHNISMNVLSMGMSSDYEEAVMEGATLVRVGSAIFGERVY